MHDCHWYLVFVAVIRWEEVELSSRRRHGWVVMWGTRGSPRVDCWYELTLPRPEPCRFSKHGNSKIEICNTSLPCVSSPKDLIPEDGTQKHSRKFKCVMMLQNVADVAIPAGIVQFALLIILLSFLLNYRCYPRKFFPQPKHHEATANLQPSQSDFDSHFAGKTSTS